MHFQAFFGAYVQVVVVVEFPSILEPFDIWPGFASGHANEHNFVAQYVLVIEMRGLCYAGTLEPNREERCLRQRSRYCICREPHSLDQQCFLELWLSLRDTQTRQ